MISFPSNDCSTYQYTFNKNSYSNTMQPKSVNLTKYDSNESFLLSLLCCPALVLGLAFELCIMVGTDLDLNLDRILDRLNFYQS